MEAGTDGQALTHSFSTGDNHFEAVCLCAPQPNLAGPGFVLLRGFDTLGNESVRLTVMPDDQAVQLTVHPSHGNPVQLTALIPAVPRWVSIGFTVIDSPSPTAALKINGLTTSSLPLPEPPLATQTVQIGVCLKHHDTAGTLDLDQAILSQALLLNPIPLPPITTEHADDPARWLVIYNTDLVDSVSWADHYREARGVPHANLLGLPLPTTPSINDAQYQTLRASVIDYLDTNKLRDRILGLLTGFGVPALVQLPPSELPLPTANLLASDAEDFAPVDNPIHTPSGTAGNPASNLQRATAKALAAPSGSPNPLRLSASIDAPDLNQALAITTHAIQISEQGLSADIPDRIWIDPYPDPLGSDPAIQQQLLNYWQSIHGGALRLPITLAEPPDASQTAKRFDDLTDDTISLTLRSDSPLPTLFGASSASRACSLNLHLNPPAPITSFRDTPVNNWLQAPLSAGYAAAIAPVLNSSPAYRPDPVTLFDALRQGFCLAEAFAVSLPALRTGYLLLGDPLLSIPFPQSGYDRFGPFPESTTFQTLDPNGPLHRMHAAENPFDLSSSDTAEGRYLIRRVDRHGRSDAGLLTTMTAETSSTPAPAWPDTPGWPVLRLGPQVLLGLVLISAPSPQTQITLEQDPSPEGVLPTPVVITPGQTRLLYPLPVPSEPTRFRWTLTEPGRAPISSAWSMPVSPDNPVHA